MVDNDAFLFAINNDANVITVTPGSDIPFNTVVQQKNISLVSPNSRIKRSGKYYYFFKIEGRPAVDEPAALGLTQNGTLLLNTLSTVGGSGIVQLNKNDLVTVRLSPTSPSGAIDLNSTATSGAANASLTLILLGSSTLPPTTTKIKRC